MDNLVFVVGLDTAHSADHYRVKAESVEGALCDGNYVFRRFVEICILACGTQFIISGHGCSECICRYSHYFCQFFNAVSFENIIAVSAEAMEHADSKEVNEWWSMLQEDFKRLNQNYQDYLKDFYSGKTDRLIRSVEFIVHKDKFIKYLNEFIQNTVFIVQIQNWGIRRIFRIA